MSLRSHTTYQDELDLEFGQYLQNPARLKGHPRTKWSTR